MRDAGMERGPAWVQPGGVTEPNATIVLVGGNGLCVEFLNRYTAERHPDFSAYRAERQRAGTWMRPLDEAGRQALAERATP